MAVLMNTIIRYTSDLLNVLVVSPCLRGNYIARDLSRLLILILLVLSPLTFSNDKIPNFQPDGLSNYSLKTKVSFSVAVMRPDVAAPFIGAETTVVVPHPSGSYPYIAPVCSSQPSRAPPA